jgi:ribosome-associated protein
MNSPSLIAELKDVIVATLDQHKAENIIVIDLKNKSDIADYMIIATGRSNKHVASTAEFVIEQIKDLGNQCLVEGMNNSDWVLIDSLDILVHIFNKEKRELYALESLWQA